jgi:glycosyltransferase involved in cell wall biosynthesis
VRRRLVALGADPHAIDVVYNGVRCRTDWSRRDEERADLKRALEVPVSTRVVTMIARYAPNKRHDVALHALAECPERRNIVLCLVGEAIGPHGDGCRSVVQLAARLGLTRQVRILGYRSDAPDVLAASDLCLLPSEDDPLPRALIEAMASGVPVVGVESGGTPEVVTSGVTGYLAIPGDVAGIASAIAELLSCEDKYENVAQAALASVRERFSVSTYCDRIAGIHSDVLLGRPRDYARVKHASTGTGRSPGAEEPSSSLTT